MVKPQFELTPREVPGGVVRDPALAGGRRGPRPRRTPGARAGGPGRGRSRRSSGPSGNHEWFLWLRVPRRRRRRRRAARRPHEAHRVRLQPHQRAGAGAARAGHRLVLGAGHRLLGRAGGRPRRRSRRELPGTDALVVLGGDGTFLRAAQGSAPRSTCPSWASTAARSASCPRPSRMPWSRCWASWSRAPGPSSRG